MVAFPEHRCFINTLPVPLDERVSYWEARCREKLVSFRCSPHAEEGLVAQQICTEVGSLRIGRTRANAHVIERTPESIRAFPRESIFVNLVLDGGVFAYQRGYAAKLNMGGLVVYDARYPYLMGGAPGFDVIHLDIPADLFRARFGREDLRQPLQLDDSDGAGRLFRQALQRRLLRVMDDDDLDVEEYWTIDEQVCDLLIAIVEQAQGKRPLSALSVGHLLAAREYIDQHLQDEGLVAQDVAAHIGISERHLRRLFADRDATVADYVQQRRLEQAHRLLQAETARRLTIAEIAYRCGFSNHAHFSRVFKRRYSLTPSELAGRSKAAHHAMDRLSAERVN
jgi:AraC-like DNA-binding protein